MVNNFLFELGCEELPSAAVPFLAETFAATLTAALTKAKISYGEVQIFATPRRLAVLIKNLDEEQPSQSLTRRGPALLAAYDEKGQPTQALLGFARSLKVELSDLRQSKTDKGDWVVYESQTQGSKTKDLLVPMIEEAVAALPIPKPMRWGKGDHEFARPIHWVLMLYAEELIDCEILGVKTGRTSYGHRFHHPQAIQIDKIEHYEKLLNHAFVIADFKTRRETIVEQVRLLAAEQGATALMPDALVDEVTAIVEWPQALVAHFSVDFLEVPPEVLIASMQAHQKCFALQDNKGKLLASFITVANIQSINPAQVIAGNEKVMRARLSDAAFFFKFDKKRPLSDLIPATEQVVFQSQLGSLKEKSNRLQVLMDLLSSSLQLDKKAALRSAELSKCDLMTGMVGEFPELQGLMGYYYAINDQEGEQVAQALKEQYLPRFAGDQLPNTKLGLALSLADRLDTLVGIFAIGQKPSAAKDPFKLRRHALAVVRLLIAIPNPINLSTWIMEAGRIYGAKLKQKETLVSELKAFIMERLHSYYLGLGFRIEFILAVRERQEDWLYDFDKRIRALASFVKLPEAQALASASKRVSNILQQAKQEKEASVKINSSLFEEQSERELFEKLVTVEEQIEKLHANAEYEKILSQLASLRKPVDAFFDQVMVMVDSPALKQNRLHLLARLQTLLQGVADISLLGDVYTNEPVL